MKSIILITLPHFCPLLTSAQDNLKEAKVCFDKSENENEEEIDQYKAVLDENPSDTLPKEQSDSCVVTPLFVNYTDTTNNLNIEMVAVQGGTFTMGCTSEQGRDCDEDEKPAHKVTLNDFYIGKYEITQTQWIAIMGNNSPSHFTGPDLPVERVSWNEVQEFIRKLNAKTGKKYRLPTEAEWEYAARGGVNSKGYKYSGSNKTGNVAWYDVNSGNTTHAIGTNSPNELSIYDMSGNVWEWCSDWHDDFSNDSKTNPQGPTSGSSRVLRGGSWCNSVKYSRVSYRSYRTPGIQNSNIGFRLACSPKQN